ncbi:hypothetical protein [Actinoplanes sp. NPDC049265]|uniref:hypothetical protein n=1 Tax=Actinoplanes sp. NPDC049265 TaxID=3363902 RepID=UPI0037138A6D
MPTPIRRANEAEILDRYWGALGIDDYPFSRAQEQYRLAVAAGLVWPMTAFTRYELMNDRGRAVLLTMLDRGARALVDNRSLQLLPT